jgi:DNA-binding PadR family transcriptional regulator
MGKELKSKFAILGVLSIQPMSGYDVKQVIDRSISNFWREGYGQIYPILKQFANEGLATSHVERRRGKPDRYVYTLTERGWEALRRWLAEPAEYHPERNELLLKLFFGRHSSVAINLGHVQQYRSVMVALLGRFEAIESHLRNEQPASGDLPYWLITLRHGQHLSRALLAWCDETIATLATLGEEQPGGEALDR